MKDAHGRVLATLLGLLVMALLMGFDWWLFRRYGDTNYFVWYLKNGAFISIALGFLALVWEGLAAREDMLSANPAEYLSGCLQVLAVFNMSMGIHLQNPLPKPESGSPRTGYSIALYWDSLISVFLLFVMSAFGIVWLIVVAPPNYFVTLISGTLARQEFRGLPVRPVVLQSEDRKKRVLTRYPTKRNLPAGAVDVSITKQPFVVTQAVTSLILWVASTAYELAI